MQLKTLFLSSENAESMTVIPAVASILVLTMVYKVCYTSIVNRDDTHNKKQYHTFTIRG